MRLYELPKSVVAAIKHYSHRLRAEVIVKFRRVVSSDWLEYIYNVNTIRRGQGSGNVV